MATECGQMERFCVATKKILCRDIVGQARKIFYHD